MGVEPENDIVMYVTLPCDASSHTFPNNSISKYTVKLPRELKFKEGACEVALVSCSFPQNYHNVQAADVLGGERYSPPT